MTTNTWKSLAAALLIPLLYVVASVFFDIILFIMLGWSFPSAYWFSLFLIVTLALIVSTIPARWIQIAIFGSFLAFNAIAVVGNNIAYDQLGELFVLENFRAFNEIMAGNEASSVSSVGSIVLVASVWLAFLAGVIFSAYKLRKHRAGYRWKGVVATTSMILIIFGTFALNIVLLPDLYDDLKDNRTNNRFTFTNFNFNRFHYLMTFGPSMFYARNLAEIIGLGPMLTDGGLYRLYDFDAGNPTLENAPLEFQLGPDYNLIMLMMETIELDSINPFLTPNLWRLKEHSTWVNGYYAMERTCFTEYVSLTGTHLRGMEMWSSFRNVNVSPSLPHIFRREEFDQIGGFHNFRRNFYRRDIMFSPYRLGFCFIRDMTYYDAPLYTAFELNSDSLLFDTMIEDIAPENKRFFSYVLNVGTHAPHFGSRAVFPLVQGGRLVFDEYGRNVLTSVPQYSQSLEDVLEMEDKLSYFYPRLNSGNNIERNAIIAFLTTMRDYDKGIGILIEHLENTPDFVRDPTGNTYLIDTTALVLYSDHFNYVATNNRLNNNRGGFLSRTMQDQLLGERLVFMIYNPSDYQVRSRPSLLDTLPTHEFNYETKIMHDNGDGTKGIGRRIDRFMGISDIYRTVTHLFDIQTSDRFTLGRSVLDPNSYSIGIGFVTGIYFGLCFTTGEQFTTRDLITFRGTRPCDNTMAVFRQRITTSMATMLHLVSFFERNSFVREPASQYVFNRPAPGNGVLTP